ncbi:PREDICTED: protein FAR1-RELATED SEQUENCE 7 isoform X1 [Camelina sativa]|uniref:Protein FAR1-RELATED SEQUENCE n=2 Tax=Camelina sativa TaxID=90675 RepID=A0ABM0XHL6_CAMSA|nr:PREDICTED: protein FAR1-RELATED SEQUENCE 7 isoform X1 [Camelina sativa]XP_010486115.1 PREDICTED: protein FAR1-RELATED SEQUENCE 7 isoform X1 [Camelina sativa]XP_010486116.1 PREDICTED: protein FAR1-RELATED SEQUENCE 7 isoform X1 [Camelina sativa]XP_010486117.1 PREDICTED: protein FAR1-RELATED SEQUENCE 7 isoform X1 [Camelina sativa]XP_010486118.1 PREDICTED: protein FAR1-RELATED SEQUENCE 7 isoform X1 [Camelina sativa]
MDMESADTEPNNMVVKAYPLGMRIMNHNGIGEDEGDSRVEPYVGLEFDTAEEARDYYNSYATRTGFKVRTGQLYRSRTDGTVSSRRFVCSKEGFQLNSRTGCPAFIRVQRRDTGKWVLDQIQKEHNHELGGQVEETTPRPSVQQRAPTPTKLGISVPHRPKMKVVDEADKGRSCPSGVISFKRFKGAEESDGQTQPKATEPYAGLEFSSANEACQFYQAYAEVVGFRVRIGQLFRSKVDGSITSRRFVCSKEGFQHPSRMGCGAYMRIKRQDSGGWIVDRLNKDHNHELEPGKKNAGMKKITEDVTGGLDSVDLIELNDFSNHISKARENTIGKEWYPVLFDYFQSKQAEDMGFFYAVELDSNGSCMSIFWADSRSRFACSQFGDAVVFDTSYRKGEYSVPFAMFIGFNHHRQPVLLGGALVADESKEAFSWLFQTWLRAMSGRRPRSIVADQDLPIQQAVAQVFPGAHHRFSAWQIRSKERENLGSFPNEFKYEYEKCLYQSQTTVEFDTMWSALVNKYGLRENMWLREIYEKRENWVPAYLRASFFGGIPVNGTIEPFYGTSLNSLTSLTEFISRYEQGLEQRREEERKEDFNSYNLQPFLQTKEPVEEQCRRLYTLTIFRIFQSELAQSYNYLGLKTYEEGAISRFLVRKCGNENEKHAVTFSASNLNASCSCQMFEYEGLLCRHIFKVFNLLDIRELPSRYILHRWTKNAEFGFVRDVESGVTSQDLKALMIWSLREAASKYIEFGTSSLEKYKLAYEIMREGGKKLCWQR